MKFSPTRDGALERLVEFVPKAGRNYAAERNYDREGSVSALSPYLRHRMISEREVLAAVLSRHSPRAAEKFIQEVFWRTYWKGWLEMRPAIWTAYRAEVTQGLNRLHTEAGLRTEFDAVCKGETGIDCFDFWAHQLVNEGYLHNHARMWFASIWIFTLRLPWALGADFFLRHLLDGDAASNTLSWRWVAGLHTRGKTYLARPDNIAKYTNGRFHPVGQLANVASPLEGPEPPDRTPLPAPVSFDARLKTGLLVTDDDIAPAHLLADHDVAACAVLNAVNERSPLKMSAIVTGFVEGAFADAKTLLPNSVVTLTSEPNALCQWAIDEGLKQIVTSHAPTGPVRDCLTRAEAQLDQANITLVPVMRDYDRTCWPQATAGFFKLKKKIPHLLETLDLAQQLRLL